MTAPTPGVERVFQLARVILAAYMHDPDGAGERLPEALRETIPVELTAEAVQSLMDDYLSAGIRAVSAVAVVARSRGLEMDELLRAAALNLAVE